MNIDSYDILVIILSVTLAIFLVMSIIFLTYAIRAVKDVSEMTKKAGSVVNSIEAVGRAATSNGPASFIGSIVTSVVEKALTGGEKEEEKDE